MNTTTETGFGAEGPHLHHGYPAPVRCLGRLAGMAGTLFLMAVVSLALSGCATAPAPQEPPGERGAPRGTETDVWARLSSQFALPLPTQASGRARVQHYADFYLTNSNFLTVSLGRAEPWVEYLLEELESRNLPGELFLVPLIESGFAPRATSVSGAAGIWQFMPATGAHFGLLQTPDFDGRRDVFASTEAALEYLESLHARFQDWPLALAAFNFGQGNVARAMEANQRRGAPTDYWSLELSNDAMSYVPRILAVRQLIESRRVALPRHRAENTAVAVQINAAIDLHRVAALANMPLDDLRSLNSATRSTVLPAVPGARLALPRSTLKNLAQEQRASGVDALEGARQTLLAAAALSSPPPASNAVSPVTGATRVHVVQRGESLWGIAARYGVDLGELGELNALSRGATLSPGQRLQVPAARNSEAQVVTHRVQPGETLSAIARRYGINLDALRLANHIPGDFLRAGETLVIPRLR
jgi:membrane-bound lytic murein transglycosylase D